MKEIVVIGLWHQGIVGAACMADFGYKVTGADCDSEVIRILKMGKAPIFEPGLDDLLSKGILSGTLCFSTDIKQSVIGKKEILLMYDTPVNDKDESDLSIVWKTIDEIAPVIENDALIHITTQIPVGTCDLIKSFIFKKNPKINFHITYSPENLRLGNAINRFRNPQLPVIGAESTIGFERTKSIFQHISVNWLQVELKTAEMVKHALNAFLATSICFGNEIGNICDEIGVDGYEVVRALKLEERVGPKAMILPGLGFSGGTLARDIQTLRALGDKYNLETIFFDGLWQSNLNQNNLVLRKLKKVFGKLEGINIAIFGLTYKPDTSTLRRSAAIEIIKGLASEKAILSTHDPKVNMEELSTYTGFYFYEDLYKAAENANAIVLLTPWKEYENIDFKKIHGLMKSAPLIIDTANLWVSKELEDLGFTYLNIGRGR